MTGLTLGVGIELIVLEKKERRRAGERERKEKKERKKEGGEQKNLLVGGCFSRETPAYRAVPIMLSSDRANSLNRQESTPIGQQSSLPWCSDIEY